jgi:hypothetical protein
MSIDATTVTIPDRTPKAAFVAIHGVGDHPQFELAKSVANLLEDK